MATTTLTRRRFCALSVAGVAVAAATPRTARGNEQGAFALRHILASSLYGRLPMGEVLAEVQPTGCDAIDIWPEGHANHREQIEAMGHDAFERMLREAGTSVGIYTCYNPGLFKCGPWLAIARRFGAKLVVAHSGGPAGLAGEELKQAVRTFVERLRPLIDQAAGLGMTLAIENHSHALIHSPDSMRWLAEFAGDRPVGVALAPYHLPQDSALIAELIEALGPKLAHFYAWEHGHGAMTKLPKVLEMKQLPGYGPLDFTPIVAALKAIRYAGWTSIFMHPVPRGVPILPTADEVTAAVNRSRAYLDHCLERV